MNFGEVRKLTITALFSDDLLFEELVLKGGNALSLVHGISRRASLDLDFSLAKDFEDLQDVRSRMERTLADRFASVGFVPFDVKLVPRPSNQNDESVLWWGGYRLEFKLIDEKRHRFLPMVKDVQDALMEWHSYLLRYQPKAKLVFTDPVEGVVMNNDYYKTPWERACREAGYMVEKTNRKGKTVLKPSLLFYDARRSFRTYLPDEIAKSDGMAAMGHTQDTTFGRYHVEPQRAALRVLDALEKPEAKGLTVPEQLAQLHSLFQAGALTEQMYQAACANVLGLAQPSE